MFYTQNFEHSNLLESKLAKQQVSRGRIFKKKLKIGLVPEKMILQFFEFFVKNLAFYDSGKRATLQIKNDENSLLN